MRKAQLETSFNFGPIARTNAGGTQDTINLAPFPLHVMLNALVASTSVEEFIAWLWHDLYKPAFYWVSKGQAFSWRHIPGKGVSGEDAFADAESTFAQLTGVRIGLVSSHQPRRHKGQPIPRKDPLTGLPLPMFALLEPDFISDQGDQIELGAAANYIQLTVAAEPALPTVLVRSVIADAFIEVVTKDVANAIRQAFILADRTPIEQVRFEFEVTSKINFTIKPDDKEIWRKVGQLFDVVIENNTFIMRHVTPVSQPEHEQFATTFTADLTGNPLLPADLLNNTFSLAELLVLYQDSRTVIIAVPQAQLYKIDPQRIRQKTFDTARKRLDALNVLTVGDGIDYLQAGFDAQIDIREVPGRQPKRTNVERSLDKEAILYPSSLLDKARKSSSGRICRLTGTPFVSSLAPTSTRLDKIFPRSFVDTEFVGVRGDIAPLTHLYVLNSPNAGGSGQKGVPKRTSLRGAFALLAPASHFAIDERGATAVETPPLDLGGRFSTHLNRITVTTQEFTLFQQMSRRVIAKLWQAVAPGQPLALPYLGAILLTHDSRQQIRQLLPELDTLLSKVFLKTYPFFIKVRPAIEVALETALRDLKHHSGKHTLLKISPRTITVEPDAAIPLLVDDDVQIDVNERLLETVQKLMAVSSELSRKRKKISQRDAWLKLVMAGQDPVTAAFESAAATIDARKLPKNSFLEGAAFEATEEFWSEHIDQGDLARSWEQYEELAKITTTALEEFPALTRVLSALAKK